MSDEAGRDARAWGVQACRESGWPASLAAVALVLLYSTLPDRYTLGPTWLFPVLALAVLCLLWVAGLTRHASDTAAHRVTSIGLIGSANTANVASLVLLVGNLLNDASIGGKPLIFAAIQIWLTNIIVFGLWYWELDRGGPRARCRPQHREPDFLFPQMATPEAAPAGWAPRFLDYLYLAFTNATAFSPTDTMPLTGWAKTLMTVQSIASLLTVSVVAARAVNVL